MSKKAYVFCHTIFVLSFFGCDNYDEPIYPSPFCYISSNYHFSGDIKGVSKSFINNHQNYQQYVGSTMNSVEDPMGRFVFGINTWPLTIGDEAIFIYTPLVNTEDADKVAALFPRGKLNLEQRKDFKLYYDSIIDVNNYQYERLEGKFDENSSIEICKIEKVYSSSGYTNYKIRMIFNCKLYNVGLNGESKGVIKSGEITGLISIPY
jgi:hypothetical protein